MSSEVETPQATVKQKNGKAITGFVLSIVSVLLFFTMIIIAFTSSSSSYGFTNRLLLFIASILALLGLIFSSMGMRNPQRGLAVAGLVVSVLLHLILYTATLVAIAE